MARLCERPACSAEATFTYGFDVERRIVWLDALGDERYRAGALCRRHAERLTVPRGWWLEDRRTPSSLFEVDGTSAGTPAPASDAPPAPKPRARRKKAEAPTEPPADSATGDAPDAAAGEPAVESRPGAEDALPDPDAPAEVDPGPDFDPEADPFADPTVVDMAEPFEAPEPGEPDHQWEPAFASIDPDPAVDAVSTPLLAKAFGHDVPQPGPRRRSRRPKPTATESAARRSATPAAVLPEPGPTEPGATEPGPTEPGPTEPGPTEPGATEPGPTEPGPTEPGPTEPGDPPTEGPVG